MFYTLITILTFCMVSLESFSHDAVVAYDNARDDLYFVRDGTVYRGNITNNVISPIHVVEATDALIQLTPNGDALIIRDCKIGFSKRYYNYLEEQITFSIYDIKKNIIVFKREGWYSEQPFSPNGRYFVYTDTLERKLKKIDLETMVETTWLETIEHGPYYYYGWDNRSIVVFYKKIENGTNNTYFRRYVDDKIVDDFYLYGPSTQTAFLAKNHNELYKVIIDSERYVFRTFLFLSKIGEVSTTYFDYKGYHNGHDYYFISNDREKVMLYGGGVSEENFYSPNIFKIHDFYRNYEIDIWRLDYLFDKDILDARSTQSIQFDIAGQNILVYDRNKENEHRVNWYSTSDLKIDSKNVIVWNDGMPDFSMTKVSTFSHY